MKRRNFIGQAGCAALGSTTLFSTLGNLFLTNALAADRYQFSGDYKALVCLMFAGGNDSYNMLVPRSTNQYNEYANTRADLALNRNSLLPISPITSNGIDYGVHPQLSGVQNLFDQRNLAFLSNIGTLVEPILNASEFYSGQKNLPLGLYSHADQTLQWQTSVPQSRDAIGWGGKVADIMSNLNTNPDISMNISLGGRNVFQSGNSVMEYVIKNSGNGAEGIQPIQYYDNQGFLNLIRKSAISDFMSQTYSNALQQTLASQTSGAIEAQQIFSSAIANVPAFSTNFSNHYLSRDFEMIAKVIAARTELGMCRQTFFLDVGGWDMHDEVLNSQDYLYNVVDNALTEFYAVLEELGMEEKVTTFTVSEFGRTLTSNGNGSDHAYGGNQMVMGGAVNGKEIYGEYPSLALSGNNLNLSNRGVLIPQLSTDEYLAELALWFGLTPTDLPLIFPNIGNFYSPGSSNYPIGFLQ